MPEAIFRRVPGLLGPIFEEAGTGERQMREALFLTFNVDLGFFEARLLGPVRAAGAAVTVVADSSVFAPDPRNVRSAGHGYALGLAAMHGAFHPKLTILAGPQRALIGIGSGNLTVGGWHANDEVLTTIQASREGGVPAIVGDLVTFLGGLPSRVTISPLALEGIERTADQLSALVDSAPRIDTGHRLVESVTGPILAQLPEQQVDELEVAAPFHDLGGMALGALITRHAPRRVTVLAQQGQAVMDSTALETAAAASGCDVRFVQLDGEDTNPGRYRHGKVITAVRGGMPTWSLVGSPNASAAALLGRAPSGNCELAVLTETKTSLLPTPTVPVADIPALTNTIPMAPDADESTTAGASIRLLEARAVGSGVEVHLSAPAQADLTVEISPYAASPDSFEPLGSIKAGEVEAVFPGLFTAGTRVRIGDQLQFLAFPGLVVNWMRPTGAGRPNYDSTMKELFASDVVAAQWHDALARLLLTHGQSGAPAGTTAPGSGQAAGTINWRTLDDLDRWSEYAEDALTRLGMPIFQLAAGGTTPAKPVGSSLSNAAPGWEDRFEETSESFEDDETAESAQTSSEDEATMAVELPPYQRTRLRKWMAGLVELIPHLGPLERIAVAQLAIAGSSALIWESTSGSDGWFDPLAIALEGLARDDWPPAASAQAGAVAAIGLYRLRMAVPADERGNVADRFRGLAETLKPLVSGVSHHTVSDNLELLAGTTFVARSADDVMIDVDEALNAGPDLALVRVLERVMPDLDITWEAPRHLLLSGRTTNPKATAAQVLNHASGFPELAVGVNASNGTWIVAARILGSVTLVEGGKRPTTYKTYNTARLLNPIGVLTDQDMAQQARISTPPFTKPDAADLDVLKSLGVDLLPMPDRNAPLQSPSPSHGKGPSSD